MPGWGVEERESRCEAGRVMGQKEWWVGQQERGGDWHGGERGGGRREKDCERSWGREEKGEVAGTGQPILQVSCGSPLITLQNMRQVASAFLCREVCLLPMRETDEEGILP